MLNIHVLPDQEYGWAVHEEGGTEPLGYFDSQEDAIKRAREIARDRSAELLIHGRDGHVRDRQNYGDA